MSDLVASSTAYGSWKPPALPEALTCDEFPARPKEELLGRGTGLRWQWHLKIKEDLKESNVSF